jgi:DNA-binding NtrC family response regulator
MDAFRKVLVVDDGERSSDRALSAELAELGYASVTASLEATEDVLAVIPRPSAILLQLPNRKRSPDYESFMELAKRLQANDSGIPVILVDSSASSHPGGYASVLQDRFGARALAKPEL